jgi:hypothetical protein
MECLSLFFVARENVKGLLCVGLEFGSLIGSPNGMPFSLLCRERKRKRFCCVLVWNLVAEWMADWNAFPSSLSREKT